MSINSDFTRAMNLASALVLSEKKNEEAKNSWWGSKTVVVLNTETKEYMVMSEWRASWSLWWNNTADDTKREITKVDGLIELLDEEVFEDENLQENVKAQENSTNYTFTRNLRILKEKNPSHKEKLDPIINTIWSTIGKSSQETSNKEQIEAPLEKNSALTHDLFTITYEKRSLNHEQQKALQHIRDAYPQAVVNFVSHDEEEIIAENKPQGEPDCYITIPSCNISGFTCLISSSTFATPKGLTVRYENLTSNGTSPSSSKSPSPSFPEEFDVDQLPMDMFTQLKP